MATEAAMETLILIPGLPNDVAAAILSAVPFPFHGRLKSTSRSWRRFFSSEIPLSLLLRRRLRRDGHHLLCLFPQDPTLSPPFLFDPAHLGWCPLPPLPVNPHAYSLCNFSAVSSGRHVYLLGGSLFDTRSFPLDRPVPSRSAFRFDLLTWRWDPLPPMITPRGSFACAAAAGGRVLVAGGGSRHAVFGAAGTRVGSAERYDAEGGSWVPLEPLPGDRARAGCVGFVVARGEGEGEFWVMGGYGEPRIIGGVLPVDDHYRDAVVMDLRDGRWREVGDMWEPGERPRLGKVAVIIDDDDECGGGKGCVSGSREGEGVFMLDGNDIFRYSMSLNCWFKESTVPRPAQDGSTFGFVALRDELHIISLLQGFELSEVRRSRQRRRGTVLFMQIYHPGKKSWRSLVTRTPFSGPLDFKTAVMCTIRV